MRKYLILFLFPILFSCQRVERSNDPIELTDGWEFHLSGQADYYPASVPGTVHMDLLQNGLIPDPFYASNEDSLQWVGEKDWEYKTTFSMESETLDNNLELVFEGLDTHADVYLNDQLILNADNMFRTYKLDVSGLLKDQNTLNILFHSAEKKNKEMASKLAYTLPEERAHSRKAPYQMGWDWGPKFATAGIWRPVYIKIKQPTELVNVHYQTLDIENENAKIQYTARIESNEESTAILKIKVEGKEVSTKSIEIKNGLNKITDQFVISKPKLWWTNGLGDPHLYNMSAELIMEGKTLSLKNDRIGIRTIEWIQEADEKGKSFYAKLNGVPVFMKGANYIPQDNFLNRTTFSQYEKLIQSSVDANMNMLRIWGGGTYETDWFYDLCDENGLLVWQDFMFACAFYPGDSAFLRSVQFEATDQIIRLRNHPSIALWCGNNEVDEAYKNWGWQKQFNYTEEQEAEVWSNYEALFHEVLLDVVKENDNGRFYWPSSPSIGWGHAESLTQGDAHYWGVWWGEQPFDFYEEKVGRFMSEYGFQGFPSMKTLRTVVPDSAMYLVSNYLRNHEKHARGFELIQMYMERDYKVPVKIEDYAYVSQLLQAEGMGLAMEAHRRAMPYCMGTLYWQLNDCWPVISWAGLDYYGRWKALHYKAKKLFKNQMISTNENKGKLDIYVVSDDLKDIDCSLSTSLISFEGEILFTETSIINLSPNTSQIYKSLDMDKLIKNYARKDILLSTKLRKGDEIIAENMHYFVKVKDLILPNPHIEMDVKKHIQGYAFILSSTKLAKNVFLEVEGFDGRFSDNYFDLISGTKKQLIYYTDSEIDKLNDLVKIKSLYNCY